MKNKFILFSAWLLKSPVFRKEGTAMYNVSSRTQPYRRHQNLRPHGKRPNERGILTETKGIGSRVRDTGFIATAQYWFVVVVRI